MAVAGEIDETHRRIQPVDPRLRGKGAELFPVAIARSLVEAGHGTGEVDEVEEAVAGEIEPLRRADSRSVCRRLRGDQFSRTEGRGGGERRGFGRRRDRREITLVVERAVLLGEDAGQALAIEIEPAARHAVDARRHIVRARDLDLPDLVADDRLAVFELERWQRLAEPRAVAALHVAGVLDRAQRREHRSQPRSARSPSGA